MADENAQGDGELAREDAEDADHDLTGKFSDDTDMPEDGVNSENIFHANLVDMQT